MSATRLSYTDVLTDEFEYFFGSPEARQWRIDKRAVRELPSLAARIKAINDSDLARTGVVPERFRVLARSAKAAEFDAREQQWDAEKAVLEGFAKMVEDPDLFTHLSKDAKVEQKLRERDSLLLRKLVSVPHARRLLFVDREVSFRIATQEPLVAVFTVRSAALRLSRRNGITPAYVRTYPALLSTIADSRELSDHLLAQDIKDPQRKKEVGRERRKMLAELLEPDVARAALTEFLQRFSSLRVRQAGPRLHVTDRSEVAKRPDKLLALLKSPPPQERQPRRLESLPPLPEIPLAYLTQFNVFLLETAFDDHIADGHDMRDLYSRIHEKNVAALCLSGGGIRSATFNLGVLQALAEKNLLTQFHYISTVSGGGYIGSWLSSWIRRHSEGPAGVSKDLAAAEPMDPLSPEVEPIHHLREYSSYLAPRATALSVDTWTIVATYLRNLFLNWTMFLPAVAAFLAIPRLVEVLVAAALPRGMQSVPPPPSFLDSAAITAVAAGLLGVIMVGWIRPASDQPSGPSEDAEALRAKRQAVWFWVVPLFAGAVAFTTFWAALANVGESRLAGRWTIVKSGELAWWALPPLFIAGNILAVLLYLVRRVASKEVPPLPMRALQRWLQEFRVHRAEGKIRLVGLRDALVTSFRNIRFRAFWSAVGKLFSDETYRRSARGELGAAVGAGLVGGLLLNGLFRAAFDPRTLADPQRGPVLEIYVCTAIPLFLLVFFLATSLHVGLATRSASEHDREWWSRTGALIFLFGLVYLVVSSAAILLPILVMTWTKTAASVGGTAAWVSWLLSRGNRTAANLKEREMVGAPAWTGVVLKVAAFVCLLLAVAVVSITTTSILSWILPKTQDWSLFSTNMQLRLPSLDKWSAASSIKWHLKVLRNVPEALLLAFILGMLAIAWRMSRALNVNTYSMHAMYRNRLIRAYLGASRWTRRPDPFTGFDPQDDIKMWQLRPEVIWPSSFVDVEAFLKCLSEGSDTAGSPFRQLPESLRKHVIAYVANPDPATRDDVQAEVVLELNKLMLSRDIEHDINAEPGLELLRDNRNFLDSYFGRVLEPMPVDEPAKDPLTWAVNGQKMIVGSATKRRRPGLHVVNMALNLVGGDNLAWRERKADSFTVTPLHAGNRRLGYRDTSEYGDQLTLGTAMAISGAAVSPNMGYNSSPVVTFLMTLFNARLGWWLGNPGNAGQKTFRQPGPTRSLKSIVDEAFGRTNDKSPYVFLSDGGHFDNLGLYEMVLRRCRYIVACDASADRRYAFGDLANAIRKIRVDLGVDIELRSTIYIGPHENEKHGKYCAIGYIRYDKLDKNIAENYANVGYLVYIKPVVYSDCPTDVRHYRQENEGFPHESTADQFFSESQFESYRALGRHIVGQISEEMGNSDTIFDLVQGALAYVYKQQAPIGDRKVQNVSDLVGWMERSLK